MYSHRVPEEDTLIFKNTNHQGIMYVAVLRVARHPAAVTVFLEFLHDTRRDSCKPSPLLRRCVLLSAGCVRTMHDNMKETFPLPLPATMEIIWHMPVENNLLQKSLHLFRLFSDSHTEYSQSRTLCENRFFLLLHPYMYSSYSEKYPLFHEYWDALPALSIPRLIYILYLQTAVHSKAKPESD